MERKKEGEARRSFLKGVLAGSAVLAGLVSSAKESRASLKRGHTDSSEILYRETEDFRKYYESLRSS